MGGICDGGPAASDKKQHKVVGKFLLSEQERKSPRVLSRRSNRHAKAMESSIIDGGNSEECIAKGKLGQLTERLVDGKDIHFPFRRKYTLQV
jgi:hypothetical protein